MAEVIWTKAALGDLNEIGDYIAQDSIAAADKLIDSLYDAPDFLEDFPLAGRIVPEANKENIREVLHSNYRIIYFLNKDVANIVAVYHAARKITRKAIVKRTSK